MNPHSGEYNNPLEGDADAFSRNSMFTSLLDQLSVSGGDQVYEHSLQDEYGTHLDHSLT
jgi:hypothetical protein